MEQLARELQKIKDDDNFIKAMLSLAIEYKCAQEMLDAVRANRFKDEHDFMYAMFADMMKEQQLD